MLTQRGKDTLKFIEDFMRQNDYAPTMEEIAVGLGIKSVGSTHYYVEQLLKAGELERLNTVAGEMNTAAPISIRVNPDVDAGTHPYISTGLKENKRHIACLVKDADTVRTPLMGGRSVLPDRHSEGANFIRFRVRDMRPVRAVNDAGGRRKQ